MHRYEKIAEMMAEQIENRSLAPGARLPSLRKISRDMDVSIGTVQRAYTDLEDRGLIVPRQRSGYYVRAADPAPSAGGNPLREAGMPERVRVMDTAVSVMRSAARPELVQLGSAVPDVSGSAVAQLHLELKRRIPAIVNWEEDPLGYLPLRRQLARRAMDSGVRVHPDDIVVTAGCQEALTIALRCITRPGDLVAVESPCYYGLLQALEVLELDVIELPASPRAGISISHLASVLQQWPVKGIVLTPAFSNPSGYRLSRAKKEALVRLISAHDIPLIEDEAFADLSYAGDRPHSIRSLDNEGRVILCGSLSKSLCSDFRIGWVMGGRYNEAAARLKFVSSLCAPHHTQAALAAFLSTRQYDRHLQRMRPVYERRRDHLIQGIKRHFPGECRATVPLGGFLSWVRLPEDVDGLALFRRSVRKGVSLTPGRIFASGDRFKNYIRLNYAVAGPREMDRALSTVGDLIRDMSSS